MPDPSSADRQPEAAYQPVRNPWDGPYDWDAEQEAWVCQAHGTADCRQSEACVYYGRLALAADPDGLGPRPRPLLCTEHPHCIADNGHDGPCSVPAWSEAWSRD